MKTLLSGLMLFGLCASPALAQLPANYKSFGSTEEITVTWKNNNQQSMYLKWVDFEGKILPENGDGHEIKAGASFTGTTYAGHIFRFKIGGASGFQFLIPSGKATRTIEVYPKLGEGITNANTFTFDDQFQSGTYSTMYGGAGVLWVHSWKFKSNNQGGSNYLTEISRTRNSIELQDPKDKTKIILRKTDNGGGISETTRVGKQTIFGSGELKFVPVTF